MAQRVYSRLDLRGNEAHGPVPVAAGHRERKIAEHLIDQVLNVAAITIAPYLATGRDLVRRRDIRGRELDPLIDADRVEGFARD